MATEGAVHQPVVVLHVEGELVYQGIHLLQRVDQIVAVYRLRVEHGGSSAVVNVAPSRQ